MLKISFKIILKFEKAKKKSVDCLRIDLIGRSEKLAGWTFKFVQTRRVSEYEQLNFRGCLSIACIRSARFYSAHSRIT